jgi:hypothetical protein
MFINSLPTEDQRRAAACLAIIYEHFREGNYTTEQAQANSDDTAESYNLSDLELVRLQKEIARIRDGSR